MEILSKSIAETKAAAEKLLVLIAAHKHTTACVVALSGDLGSGKTTFTQEVAKLLGVVESVPSPTFIIERIYKLQHERFDHLIHIDAYRLESAKEIVNLGWHEMVNDPNNLIFVEWPERIAEVMPKDAVKMQFLFVDERTRRMSIDA